MNITLSDRTLANLKSVSRRLEVRDVLLPSFGVRITTNNHKTFFVMTRVGKRKTRITIGKYPIVSLAAARKAAMEHLRNAQLGLIARPPQTQISNTVDDVVGQYIEQYAKLRTRTWEETRRVLNREIATRFSGRDIASLKREDLILILDDAMRRGAPYQANRSLARVRKFLNWCIERGLLPSNPAFGLKPPGREIARDRILSDLELRGVFVSCDRLGYPFGPFIKMLVLTAQRRGEVAGMRWSEVDFESRIWTIPALRAKNGRLHTVPLTNRTIATLSTIPRIEGSEFVFTTTGRTPISGFSKIKQLMQNDPNSGDWRFHDFRRTAASGMARSGVPPYVVEKILNHISGTISGVAAVYNRYGYDAEKREALEKWETHLNAAIETH